jgi:tetratricopeptide (TPR) repeat protein
VSEKPWGWPDTPAARLNLETLSALARAIGMAAPGRFVLLLAKCNVPVQRETLAAQLRVMLEPLGVELLEVTLDEPVSDLLSHLQGRLEPSVQRAGPAAWELLVQPQPAVAVAEPRAPYSACPPLALSVFGLEASLRSATPHPPLLAHLNLARERYRELGCPLVLWLPDYALTRLAREAPDFWAWRSGVFEFAPEAEMAEGTLQQMAHEPGVVTSSLDAAAKRERLALLEQLLADYRLLGEGPQERGAQADILAKMGSLRQDLGDYAEARRLYQESLDIAQQLGDRAGIARTLHNLGILAHRQGDYVEARRLYQESLDIKQQLGDRLGVATTLHQLGMLAQDQGNYAEACRLYQESLDIKQQLGNRAGVEYTLGQMGSLAYAQGDLGEARRLYDQVCIVSQQAGDRPSVAVALRSLGMLAQNQGDYAEARRLYQESLDITQQLGDRAGVASTLHQLGTLAHRQGDYAEARRLYQESLDIKQQLGDRAGVASTLHQLGTLAQDQGGYAEAHRLYQEALDIKQQLGDRADSAFSLAQLALLEEAEGNRGRALELTRQAQQIMVDLGNPEHITRIRQQRERLEGASQRLNDHQPES